MKNLQKLTTLYVNEEDRIRVTGCLDNGASAVLWLTQRLLHRLIPTLVGWLETPSVTPAGPSDVIQSFKQQAATQAGPNLAPVEASSQSEEWVVTSVDYTTSPTHIQLTFRGTSGQNVSLTLSPEAMRQWLDIVHKAHIQAEWPRDKWPAWISSTAPGAPDQAVVRH